ncbi:MAG: urease accessory protein UreF [Kaiparowitsia implicata GSE-PSE-MK54-09C]|nr:urease accessory protein UreF [Kaiparowitsia implicata GSE-PSE-MK54-09C]
MPIPADSSASSSASLAYLLQLASPALPVGGYTYSEGLETLVQQGLLTTVAELEDWLTQELQTGAVRLEAVAIARLHAAVTADQPGAIAQWNQWLSALRDTEEVRLQSWQMGRSLVRLMQELEPDLTPVFQRCGDRTNFATAFAIAAAHWQIPVQSAMLGYLHSWLTTAINAGVKLIPLGQTAGQRLLMQLYPTLHETVETAQALPDEALYACNWGWAIASMNHETLYTRLFRS